LDFLEETGDYENFDGSSEVVNEGGERDLSSDQREATADEVVPVKAVL
jgi:hypothetical protein